jgi:methylaspartate ammonia-lyase
MKIVEWRAVPSMGGWYCDDKAAFEAGATPDYYLVRGRPKTPGFRAIREVGEGLCILARLENGRWVSGDCVSVTYGGAAGRDPVFRATEAQSVFQQHWVAERGTNDFASFRDADAAIETFEVQGRPLHTALRYGLSQVMLEAFAATLYQTKAEVLATEYGLKLEDHRPRIGIQSGDDRYNAVDKAIYRRVDVLPHGLIKNVAKDLGPRGETLLEYARWIRGRLDQHEVEPTYRPHIHFDLYGTVGRLFESDVSRMADYLAQMSEAVKPLSLQAESVVEEATQAQQIQRLAELRAELSKRGLPVSIIVDEWCNTLADVKRFLEAEAVDMVQIKMPDLGGIGQSVEAAVYCRAKNVGVYMGGSCNETDLSARTAVHVAVATKADQILARPGMGVDEGVMIVNNELTRLRAVLFQGS